MTVQRWRLAMDLENPLLYDCPFETIRPPEVRLLTLKQLAG